MPYPTVNDIKAYLDGMKSDDPEAFGEAMQGILESCWFWKRKLDKPFVDEAIKLNIDNPLTLTDKKDILTV